MLPDTSSYESDKAKIYEDVDSTTKENSHDGFDCKRALPYRTKSFLYVVMITGHPPLIPTNTEEK
jgi:hypothetical protein